MTEREFEVLYYSCPEFKDCSPEFAAQFEELEAEMCNVAMRIADELGKEGVEQLMDMLAKMENEKEMMCRYYFYRGLIAGRKE